MKTIFERIIAGELPCTKVYEDSDILAIEDIHPQAPVHILIIPKKHFPDLQNLPESELHILGKVAKVAQKIAKEKNILGGYRLLTNNGAMAGQTIFHLHFHLLGGEELVHLV
jgi:histidine triad (HIT) family protein